MAQVQMPQVDDVASCRELLAKIDKSDEKEGIALLKGNKYEQMVRKRGWPKACRPQLWVKTSRADKRAAENEGA